MQEDAIGDGKNAAPDCGIETAPVSEGSPAAEPAELISASLRQAIDDGAVRLLQALDDRLAVDRFRETQIDRLHAELQTYKADLVTKAIRPVFQSLIRLHDDLGKLLDVLAREEPAKITAERTLGLLAGVREDVELALEHNGVSTYRAPAGAAFDPRRQKVIRMVETTEPAASGQLAAQLRPGFEYGETILEKERVAIYMAAPDTAPAEGKSS